MAKTVLLIIGFGLIVIGATAFMSAAPQAQTTQVHSGQTPVVAELFTSQSCSSCPPADEVLRQLSEYDNVIALSCNVTYWNHLHWKDTLSQEFCTQRQREYAKTLKARGPYTPQMVINGHRETVGSRGKTIKKWIGREARNEEVAEILIHEESNILNISFPVIDTGGQDLSLTLFAFDGIHEQDIRSGENSGKRINYTHPVKHLVDLGPWNGGMLTLQQDLTDMNVSGGYAVIAQAGSHGQVLAAGQMKK